MTCVVGMIDKVSKKVIMGADSQGSNGLNKTTRKDVKIFKNKDFVIGCTSSYRMVQLLRFSFTPPPIDGKDVYEYMCSDFINKVRECFKDGGYLQKDNGGDDKGGTFLVGYKDRLFKIEGDFQVGESAEGFYSCGCGEDFALGSLYTTRKEYIPTKNKVLKALESAEYLALGVGKPFVILTT